MSDNRDIAADHAKLKKLVKNVAIHLNTKDTQINALMRRVKELEDRLERIKVTGKYE